MKSIKNKILLVVISGLLIITSVVSGIAVSVTYNIMNKDAEKILSNVSEKEAALINDVLGDVEKSADILDHYTTNEISDISEIFDSKAREKFMEKTKKMFVEIAFNTSGVDSFFIRLNPEYFNSGASFYGVLTESAMLNSTPFNDLTKYNKTDKENVGWYYTAVEAQKGVWLEPYCFAGSTTQFISFVQPLYVNGELLGVIGFDMEFKYLVERINSIVVYEEGYALLLDKNNSTVYNPEHQKNTDSEYAKAVSQLKNGMFLELRAEYNDIQRDIYPMLFKIVIAFMVVLFVIIIFTIVVTYKIVTPLKRLTVVAKGFASGTANNDELDIHVDSKDEIGTLSKALKNAYKQIQDYTAYINALAHTDSLTGISNNTACVEAKAELNKQIENGEADFAVMVADVNNLKKANDKFGHDIGNELIKNAANVLTQTFKNSSVFRIGGDEFAVVLNSADYNNYKVLSAELDKACLENGVKVSNGVIPLSIAKGICKFEYGVDSNFEDVFVRADQEMYLNKQKMKSTLTE